MDFTGTMEIFAGIMDDLEHPGEPESAHEHVLYDEPDEENAPPP